MTTFDYIDAVACVISSSTTIIIIIMTIKAVYKQKQNKPLKIGKNMDMNRSIEILNHNLKTIIEKHNILCDNHDELSQRFDILNTNGVQYLFNEVQQLKENIKSLNK